MTLRTRQALQRRERKRAVRKINAERLEVRRMQQAEALRRRVMTEAEWLASTDPAALLGYLRPGREQPTPTEIRRISDRKLQLWLAAMFDMSTHNYDTVFSEILAALREGVDRSSSSVVLMNWANAWCDKASDEPGDPPMSVRCDLLRDIVGNPFRPVSLTSPCHECHGTGKLKQQLYSRRSTDYHFTLADTTVPVPDWEVIEVYCKACLGSGKTSKPCWLTPTVISIAQRIYDERDYDPVAYSILADALEDGGCDNEEIMRHCRCCERCPHCEGYGHSWDDSGGNIGVMKHCGHCKSTGIISNPHVRGCWVVDLLLGKE